MGVVASKARGEACGGGNRIAIPAVSFVRRLCANILANSYGENGRRAEGVDPLSTKVMRNKTHCRCEPRKTSVRRNWIILPQEMRPDQISFGEVFVSTDVVLVRSVGVGSRVLIVEDASLITAARTGRECLRQLDHILVNHAGRNLVILERSTICGEWV